MSTGVITSKALDPSLLIWEKQWLPLLEEKDNRQTNKQTNKQTKETNKQASYLLEYATIEDTIRHNVAQMPSKSKAFVPCLLATIIKWCYTINSMRQSSKP